MPPIAPTPVEVALRSRLALLTAQSSGRPVSEDALLASVVAAGYPRELVAAALETVRSRNEAYLTRGGWMPGPPPAGRPQGPGDAGAKRGAPARHP